MSVHVKVDRLPCMACENPWRRGDQYVCGMCGRMAPMFNHVRPPEMQGAAQSIFAPWPAKVRGSQPGTQENA